MANGFVASPGRVLCAWPIGISDAFPLVCSSSPRRGRQGPEKLENKLDGTAPPFPSPKLYTCHLFIDAYPSLTYIVINSETKLMHQIWRLSESSDNNLGLACSEKGLVLGRTLLVERRNGRFVVRERHEIARLLGKAYAAEPRLDRLMYGLGNVAAALNASDQCLARLAAVHLEIPDLADKAARDAMEAVDILLKSADWNPALHPRLGTSPNPGWFATIEGDATESPSIRTAQNSNTLSDASQGASRPGDHFPTQDKAAIAALLAAEAARSTNLEYAGRIYQSPDGSFSYT